jgi:transglutaminase-like putative cysteine protease
MLVATWLGAFFLAWSVFRWNNPWLALIPGGLALLMDISYLPGQFSPAFVAYLIAAILLVGRTHFGAKMKEWRRTGTPYPGSLHFFSINQTLVAALVLVGAAWLLPMAGEAGVANAIWRPWTEPIVDRVAGMGRVFTAVEGKGGLPMNRFVSFLPYRGYFDSTKGPIMRVKSSQPTLLRAMVYDVYTASGWKTGDRSHQPLEDRSAEIAAELDAASDEYRQPAVVEVEVQQALPVFVAPGEPLAADRDADIETGADASDVTSLRPPESLKPGDSYSAVGLVSTASSDILGALGDDYPSWVTDRYLQLPDDLPSSVRELAAKITSPDSSPYDNALSIEDYLRRYPVEFTETASPGNTDAVSYFLFEQKRGHPLYHASAMVVLLRTLGIPARLAVGFALSSCNDESGVSVDGSNALAWPEVYFPGAGWIAFSPSQAYPRQSMQGTESMLDPSDSASARQVLDSLPANDRQKTPVDESAAAGTTASEDTGSGGLLLRLTPFLVLATLSLAVVVTMRYTWNRGMSSLSYPAQLWEKTRRLSSWAGGGPQPSQTPREFLRGLEGELAGTADLPVLSGAYERVEFGGKSLSVDEEAKLSALWRVLRSRLLRRILRRRLTLGGRR